MDLELPFLTPDVPPLAARVKERPEDFEVEEIPAYAPSGEGEHVLFEVEKRDLTTQAALERVARALGRPKGELGYAGLKDARAVTRQWLSVHGVAPEAVRALALEGLRVLSAERHGNKLRVGHLRGNRFRLRLRGVEPERADDVDAVLARLVERGLPNAFGPQRFGKDGASWRLGRELVAGGARRERRRRSKSLLRLYVSAWQSWLFNRVLAARWGSFDRLLDGDLAWLHDRGAVFAVADAPREAERARRGEISPTGPLCGETDFAPEGEALAIERAALAAEGVPDGRLGGPPFLRWQGARRALRVPLAGIERAFERDEHGPFIELAFELPPGSYATVLVRELVKRDDSESSRGSTH
jgi:tRNA pseudouridine13 synthase